MIFENEITKYILKQSAETEVFRPSSLPGKCVFVANKGIMFHLLPIPFCGINNISPLFFQQKILEYSSQGVQLVHLWQDYWEIKQPQVLSRIAVFLGNFYRVYARNTDVMRISRNIASDFLNANHLQGAVNARYNYGLYHEKQLISVASFSSVRKFLRNNKYYYSFELLRYSNLLNFRVTGGLGKLINHFVKEVNPDDIMTYADLDWATGAGYKALNFDKTEITHPQSFWINPADMLRHYTHRLPQHMIEDFNKQKKYDNLDDFLKNRGYFKIYNAGNYKYILTLK